MTRRPRPRRSFGETLRVGAPALPILATLLLAACGHSAPTQFYTLDAEPPSSPPARLAATPPIRVLAVRMPPLLDRLEVAREITPGAVQVDDLNRWSAPLGELARSALSEDLAERLPGVQVLPARVAAPERTRDLLVEILSLRRVRDGFELEGAAVISQAASGAVIDSQTLRLFTPSPRADAAAQAQALGRLLATLADQLAPRLAESVAP